MSRHIGVIRRTDTAGAIASIATLPQLLPLSVLLESAVGCSVPDHVMEELPGLEQDQWDTALRGTALVLKALESDPDRDSSTEPPSRNRSSRARARKALWAIGDRARTPPTVLSAAVLAALAEFAQDDPAATAAVSHLGLSKDHGATGSNTGLCLRGNKVRLSEVIWLTDGSDVPGLVQEVFPKLTQNEWEAAVRATKLILYAVESDPVQG
jgi:hypothetical protein